MTLPVIASPWPISAELKRPNAAICLPRSHDDLRSTGICRSCAAILSLVKGRHKQNFLGKMDEEIQMKKSRFIEAQIMAALRQTAGGPVVPGLCRKHGIRQRKLL